MFPLCVHAFAQAFPPSLNILLLDNGGARPAARLTLPEHGRLGFLPPYGPELSPIERGWREVKDHLAWQQCTDLDAQQDGLTTLLRAY